MSNLRLGIGLGIIPTAARPGATTAPVNVVKPSFDGILTQGHSADVNPGSWTGLPSPNFAYAIKRSGATVSTDPNYVWTAADVAAGANAMTVEVTATNDIGPTLAISDPVTIAAPLALSGTPGTATVGTPYAFTPTRTGGHAPFSFALTGTLQSGLSFSTSTGAISGTPVASGTASLSITVTDDDGLTSTLGPFDLVASSGAPVIPAPFSRVNGPANDPFTAAVAGSFEGWTVDSATTIAEDTAFTVERPGFDSAGAVKTHRDKLFVRKKIRQPAPNDALLSTSTYALSDYLYANDAPAGGVPNNTALTSPKPIAQWVSLDRLTVPNTIGGAAYPVEVIAGHRNARDGREVACVIYKITDGTTTISVPVSTVTISPNPYDAVPVQVFALPETDTSSLADGLLTVNAEVYPFIGGASSVRKSADSSNQWEFSPRYYRKSAALVASYPIAYVDAASGNDGTGVVSTNDLTARAAPFATIKGAGDAADAAFGASATGIDNLHILLNDGTYPTTSWAANRRQKISRIIIQRSPTSTSRGAVIFSPGATTWNPNLTGSLLTPNGSLLLRDVQITRAGAQALVNAAIVLQLENFGFSNGAQTNTPLTSAQACMTYMNGGTPTQAGNQRFVVQTLSRLCLVRGWSGAAGCPSWERLCIVGCVMDQPSLITLLSNAATPAENTIVAFNKFTRINSNILWGNNEAATNVGTLSLMNLFEWTSTTSGHSMAMSNDSRTYSNIHTVLHHNTFVGWSVQGRENMFYDEGATPRLTQLAAEFGNIHVASFTKGDRFRYTNEGNPEGYTTEAPSQRLGNWAYLYGVDCDYNFSQFTTNGPLSVDNQAQVLPGRGTVIGVTWNNTSQTVRLDPLFVDNKGTKSVFEATGAGSPTTAQAGAGNGDYRLQAGSPAKNVVLAPIRPFTADGVAVGETDNMGALSATA